MQLLMMSITGSVMILVIALLRVLLQNKLHRSVILALWFLAILRLIVPIFPKSSASVYNVLPQRVSETANVTQSVVVTPSTGAPIVYTEAPALNWREILPIVWTIGCMACLLFFMAVHIRARLRYRFAIPEDAPSFLGKIKLRRLEGLTSPLVYGLLRPTILLPSGFPQKDSEEFEHVLRHELRHVRNGDLWYKLLLLLVTSLHWFNPFVWLMLYLASQDMEMRCDAQVVKELGAKRAYAQTLVQAEVGQLNHLVQTCFAFSATAERIRALSRAKTHLLRSVLVCIIAAALLLTCFATARNPSETTSTQQEEAVSATQMAKPRATTPSRATKPPTETTQESSSETEPTTEFVTELATEPSPKLTTQSTSESKPEPETEPTTEPQPSETIKVSESYTPTEPSKWPDEKLEGFSLGHHELYPLEPIHFHFLMMLDYTFSTDRPDCIGIEVKTNEFYECDLTIRTYNVGTANIYVTVFDQTYWVGSITVLPPSEKEEQSLAEMNGDTPSVIIPEFTAPIP